MKYEADRNYSFQEIATIPASERGWICPRIICKDGFRFSVQASSVSYAHPRNDTGVPYTHFEMGYPSEAPTPAILKYAEDWSNPTECIYPYVPRELIEELIELHGGEGSESDLPTPLLRRMNILYDF